MPSDTPSFDSANATPFTTDSTNPFFVDMDKSGARRARQPVRKQAPTRPPTSAYKFSSLLDIPRRLFRPPSPTVDSIAPSLAGQTTGVVRSMERVKLKDVTLQDLLQGRHLPPLTLKDFEDYLCFVELAAENLYFDAFYKEYTKVYNASTPDKRSPSDTLALLESYHIALDSFFDSASPLEINVAGDVRRQLDQDVAALPTLHTEPFLPPSAFDKIYHETSTSLEHSFHSFLLYNVRNAERNRARFAKFVGAMTWALGLIPTIVCTVLDKHRAWRALGIPLWWFGFVVFMGGVHRTCLVVYLFGDNRQLRPWELMRPAGSSSASSASTHSPATGFSLFSRRAPSPSSPDSADLEKGTIDSGHGSPVVPPSPGKTLDDDELQAISPFAFNDFNYFPTRRASIAPSASAPPGHQRQNSASTSKIDYAPSVIQPSLMVSSPTFASLTGVTDPIVKRAQWETVAAAAVYGVIAAALTTAVCLSVPNRHH